MSQSNKNHSVILGQRPPLMNLAEYIGLELQRSIPPTEKKKERRMQKGYTEDM